MTRARYSLLSVILIAPVASAAPTQQDVFRSIQDNVGSTTDPTKFLAFLLGVVALVILFSLLHLRRDREAKPKVLNHHGRLLKEIAKSVELRPAEIKQLKLLADQREDVSSPLTLLLCPSLLTETVKQNASKVDKKTILSIARKLS